jgi:hypothetical protein
MWGREGTLAVAFRTHTSMFHNLHDSHCTHTSMFHNLHDSHCTHTSMFHNLHDSVLYPSWPAQLALCLK